MFSRQNLIVAVSTFLLAISAPSLAAADYEIDADYLDAVSELLATQKMPESTETQMTQFIAQQAFNSLAAQGVTLSQPIQAVIMDESRKSFGSKFSDIEFLAKTYAPVYAAHLSESDLRELNTFWKSPVGKKMVESNQALAEGTFAALQAASPPFLPDFQKNLEARLIEAGLRTQAP